MEKNQMKEPLCIDTDICIDFLRNRNPGSFYFSQAIETRRCFISAITAYELMLGAKMMKRFQDIDGFLSNLGIIPFTFEIAKKAADLHAELRKGRNEIGLPDTFIAATCLAENIPLLTGNKEHYLRVRGLNLVFSE